MTAHWNLAMRKNHLQDGVTILEALIAMLILAFGMMAFVGVDSRLRIASDIAKQRSEAVRLAQEDIENFRAFGTLAVDGTITNNFAYGSIVSAAAYKTVLASDVITTTNATYTITRSVVDSSAPAMKDVRVTVGWTDRTGTAQQVVLRSVIAGIDPKLGVELAIAPSASPVKDPLGRDVRVPLPAKDLGNGTSAFKPVSGGTLAFVFNNETGEITGRCTVAASTFTPSITLGALTCNSVNGYLLSGFIRFSYSDNRPDATSPNDPPLGSAWAIRLDLSNAAPPASAQGTAGQLTLGGWPTVDGATGETGGYTAPECASENLRTIQYTTPVSYSQTSNGTTVTASTAKVVLMVPASVVRNDNTNNPYVVAAEIAPYAGVAPGDAATTILNPLPVPNGNDPIERYVAYTCVVYPIDLDSDVTTPNAWTGRATIWPTGITLGTSSSTYKVCRYSADYNLNGYVSTPPAPYTAGSTIPITQLDNTEHPYAYLNAQTGISNQNFLIIAGNKACPTDGDVEVNGQGQENYTDETTVLHQP